MAYDMFGSADSPFGDPKTAALLGLAQGLLAAGAPHSTPTGFGGALSQGIGGALSGAMNAQKYNLLAQQTSMTGLNAAHALYQAQLQHWWLNGRQGPPPTPPAITGFPGIPSPASPAVGPVDAAPSAAAGPTASPPAYGTPGFQPSPQTPQIAPRDAISQLPPYAQEALTANMVFPGAGMGSVIMDANKPLATRYGIYTPQGRLLGGMMPPNALPIKIGPDGQPSVEPLPGQLDATTAITEAAEKGKAPYAFEPYTTASGQTIGVPKSVAAKGPEAIKSYVSGLVGGGQAPAPAPKPNPADPWSSIPKISQSAGIGQSTYDKNIAEGRAKLASSLSEKYGAAAEQADQRISLNNQVLSLVDQADTGPGAATQAEVKSWLQKFANIPESDFANTASATKALDKDLLNAATQKAKAQFGARITQQEVQLMLSRGSPNVDMPKAAIKYLVDSDNAANNYAKRQAADLGRYLSENGDPHQFEAWYSKNFPLTSAVSQTHLNIGKPASPVKRPPLSSFQK